MQEVMVTWKRNRTSSVPSQLEGKHVGLPLLSTFLFPGSLRLLSKPRRLQCFKNHSAMLVARK